jgi:hypothetical protein
MTSRFKGHQRSTAGRAVRSQTQTAASHARARRNGRWTGYRPLEDAVREARIRAISDAAEMLP